MNKDKAGILSIQFNPKLGDKNKNLDKVKELVAKHCDRELDLIVIPEFFTTGISHEAMMSNIESSNGGEPINFLSEIAKKYSTYIICGTVLEESDDKIYNTTFVLDRSGKILAKYRKIHLFNYFGGNEGERITPGSEEVVVETDFAKIGLSICFDIRYPLHFKKLAKSGAEIFVCPAAWVYLNSIHESEKVNFIEMWRVLNRARAAENLAFMVSSNMCGKVDSFFSTTGNSMITDYTGHILNNAEDMETAIFAEINLAKMRAVRNTYPLAEID